MSLMMETCLFSVLFDKIVSSFVASNPTEKLSLEVLVVVDETLNSKVKNVTIFVTEFFGIVNVIFTPVEIKITIADNFVDNQEGVGKLPFIDRIDNPNIVGIDYEIGGVS